MANKKAHTIIDVFLPDGYGAFGYGDGGFGGNFELLNPQWNTNSGSYGIDPVTGLPFVEATSTPSFVGATAYDITYDSFFAKIVPAPAGGGSIQTGLIVKFDALNYVEMSLGPSGVFNAFGSNNNNIVLPVSGMPTYDPVAHAYWRIRNDGFLFHFDASPDGATWTELGNVAYSWDATNVSVMFFAGFNGSENPGQYALISHVNLPGTTLALSATTTNSASAWGLAQVTNPLQLSGSTNSRFGVSAKFTATLGLPEGGLTDFSFSGVAQDIDPIITTNTGGYQQPPTVPASNPTTSWVRANNAFTVPSIYRDGSYFPAAKAAQATFTVSLAETSNNFMTYAQMEFTPGFSERYNPSIANYVTGTYFAPGPGTQTVTRSSANPLSGQFSGLITSNASPVTVSGNLSYYPLPTTAGMLPTRVNGSLSEQLFGKVSIATARANTQWSVMLIFYNSAFTVTGLFPGTTYTHPGGNVWQSATIGPVAPPGTSSKWVAAVPVIQNPSSLVETVYVSGHSIIGSQAYNFDIPTTFNEPNTLNVNIKADRVNYVLNGGFTNNVTDYAQVNTNTTGSPSPVSLSWDGTTGYNSLGSAKLTFTTPTGTWAGNSTSQMGMGTPFVVNNSVPVIQGLKVGHTYTISAWIKQGPGCPDVRMNCLDANFAASGNGVSGVSTNAAKSAGNTVNGWTQISGTFTVPFNGLPDMGLFFYVNYQDFVGAGENFSFWVDNIMLEESPTANDFFDGGTNGADYQWESGSVPYFSRSYYYKNYTNKVNRLNVALPTVIPLGASYNLLFAQPISAP